MVRRLAAILAGDVAGYSRLMGEDEAATLAALRLLRNELFEPVVATHRGNVIKRMGDGWLVEFASVVDAINCAIQVQEGLAGHDRIKLRMGIHIGDVVLEDEDIYGDGVNIAARLQEIAEPGGIVISDMAQRSIDEKLAASFASLGTQVLKNIASPVTAFVWGEEPAPPQRVASMLTPRDKPSIAVLPFNNMGGDPEQEYFADGITEDVITELSRFRALIVIARNSTFTYKGQSVTVQKIGRELNVRYVVQGSVRKAANRVRITAELIDAETGSHLWAERYDRDLTDIFAVQDEITRSVVSAIAPGVLAAEDASARRKAPEDLSAWACVVRGTSRMWNVTREDFEAAAALFDQAISLDPNYALAHSTKAYLKAWNAFQGWGGRISDELAQALTSAHRALALDASDAMAHFAVGFVHTLRRHPDLALDAQRTAIELNPNSADAHFGLGMALVFAGEVEDALGVFDTSRRLNPRWLFDPMLTAFQAYAHFLAGRNEEATRLTAQSMEERQDFTMSHLVRAAALGHLGRIEEAHNMAAKVMQMHPKFTLAKHERLVPIARAEDRARYINGLRKAGLPE